MLQRRLSMRRGDSVLPGSSKFGQPASAEKKSVDEVQVELVPRQEQKRRQVSDDAPRVHSSTWSRSIAAFADTVFLPGVCPI